MINVLQTSYLKKLATAKIAVSIYLMNGIKLSGHIAKFDKSVILLQDSKGNNEQLIYKQAVSTIVPIKATVAPKTN